MIVILRKICARAYLRMATPHPLQPHPQRDPAGRSPTQETQVTDALSCKGLQRLLHFPPSWTPKTRLLIADKKEEAITDAEHAVEEVQIFTDGSGHKGVIRATATLRRQGRPDNLFLHFHLGSDHHYMVYNGEQVGILLGLNLRLGERNVPSVYMGVDNQAAILATTGTHAHSGHSLTDTFIALLDRVLEKHNLPYLKHPLGPRPHKHSRKRSSRHRSQESRRGQHQLPNMLPQR